MAKAKAAEVAAPAGQSKTEAIRQYLTSHPNAMPKEVLAALTAQGIEVSSQLISVTKSKMRSVGAAVPAKPGKAPRAATSNGSDLLGDLATLIHKYGSERVRRILEV